MNKKDDDEESFNWLGIAAGIGALVLSVAVGYAGFLIYLTWPIDVLSLEKSGQFGDSFGVINALFSGLAFAGLIIAILLQRADLQLQRNELRLARKEMQSQNFENTFFQMLRLHNEIVNAIHFESREDWHTEDGPESRLVPVSGRDCFPEFSRRFEAILDHCPYSGHDPGEHATIMRAYDDFWRDTQQALGHYFRYLYRVFQFIDQSGTEDKLLYSGIARAQLSDVELLLLFYNCLSRNGVEKFKPLAERYALFDNLPFSRVFHEGHLSLYELSAWGTQAEAVSQRLSELAGEPSVSATRASEE